MDTRMEDLNSILTRLLEVALDLGRYQRGGLAEITPPDGCHDARLSAARSGLVGIAARLLKESAARTQYFPSFACHDAVWPMLLDLYVHAVEQRKVTLSDAAIAAGVPATTSLRWIAQLVDKGVVMRTPDTEDRRRCYVTLTTRAFAEMSRYLAEIAGIATMHTMPSKTEMEWCEHG